MKAIVIPDAIEQIESAIVQHGPHNNRVYLMKLVDHGKTPHRLLDRLEILAREKEYGKVLAKIPDHLWPAFRAQGYRREATVPGYFGGVQTCCFAARFYTPERAQEADMDRIRAVMDACRPVAVTVPGKSDRLAVISCEPHDDREISRVFQQVFSSYPFPIHDPAHIKTSMESGVRYVSIKQAERIIALASLEPDPNSLTAEMGDFATLPEWRGKGLAKRLLQNLDTLAHQMGLRTAYTIARARSFGMNRVFAGNGYQHAGLLVNNTQISGTIQSMNVWYKPLPNSIDRQR